MPSCPDIFSDVSLDELRDPKFLEKRCLPLIDKSQSMTGFRKECAEYLVFIGGLRIESYMEIGSYRGGSMICTVEYLSGLYKASGDSSYRLIVEGSDITLQEPLKKYASLNPNINLTQVDHGSQRFIDLYQDRYFDLILVDGYHSYEACLRDCLFAMKIADHVAVHDIFNSRCPGVDRAWRRMGELAKDHVVNEFHQAGGDGIGVLSKHIGTDSHFPKL